MLCLACSVFIPSRCENCMSRFRTHRSLFKHLHSCSDANTTTATSTALTSEKPIFPPSSGLEKEPPGKLLEELPKLQSVIQHFKKEALLPGTMDTPLATDSLPAGLPGPLEPGPLPTSPMYPLLEQSLFGPPSLAKFSGPYMHPTSYALPQAAVQNRLRPFLPATQGLPVSNAVWKKSQGEQLSYSIFQYNVWFRRSCSKFSLHQADVNPFRSCALMLSILLCYFGGGGCGRNATVSHNCLRPYLSREFNRCRTEPCGISFYISHLNRNNWWIILQASYVFI